MTGNYFICENEIFVEGKSIGGFVSFESKENRNTIASTATIKLPLYMIGLKNIMGKNFTNNERINIEYYKIKVGAYIEVYAKYRDNNVLGHKFKKLNVFRGFIKQIVGGFPTTLICEDMSFVLRFGKINKSFSKMTPLKDMLSYILPIANSTFALYREKNNLSYNIPKIVTDESKTADIEFTLNNYKNISPYDALSKVMNLYYMYCNVNNEGKLYVGIGIKDITRKNIILNTKYNVIDRNLKIVNGYFESFKVIVNGRDSEGKPLQVELGDSDGITERIHYSPLNTKAGLLNIANAAMERLKGNINKGSITTLLYPEINLFDYIEYTDTLIPELSSNYYVIGRTLNLDKGYRQIIEVTNQMFMF